MSESSGRDRAALSREYSELLIELSIALHKFSMYPSGHPSLEPAASAVVARAEQLLADRLQVAFGVARRQLIIEGIATSEAQPVLRRLAEGLHRHHLGAVTLMRGLDALEVAEALLLLAREPDQSGPVGVQRTVAQLTWPHLRLHPLTFDGLTLASDAPITGTGGSGGGLRGAELWIGLARAAMSGGQAGHGEGADAQDPPDVDVASDAARLEPTVVAKAIDARAGAEAYDQVIVGYLLQISRELRDGGGADMAALRRRTTRLIAALSPETLRRLVEMGGDAAQRRAFVLDASQGMAAECVIDIVRAAADASGQTISHGLVRMLSKLAAHAEFGESRTRPIADAALREQVGALLRDWSLADPNPAAYTAVLQQVAVTAMTGAGAAAALDSAPLDEKRLVQMSLEVDEPGPMIDRAIHVMLAEGRASELLDTVEQAPADSAVVPAFVLARLAEPDGIQALFSGPVADFDALDRLAPHLTPASYAALLDVLVVSEHRTVRRRLLERLAAAPVDLGPLVVDRLHDARWFVQRNMLVLLDRLGRVPEDLPLAPWLAHHDARVRHEAIRLQLKRPGEREAAVRAALADGHPRLVHRGLVAVLDDCPPAVVDDVARVALDTTADDDLREVAVQALGRCRDERAVDSLVSLVDGGRTFLGRHRLAPRSRPMLAAVSALAVGWPDDPRADELVRLAAASPDHAVRRAAGGDPS
ncbi:MAG: hypothetical protein R2745_16860 [Vicinamibacterales bacterium]